MIHYMDRNYIVRIYVKANDESFMISVLHTCKTLQECSSSVAKILAVLGDVYVDKIEYL